MNAALNIHFSPLLPISWLIVAAVVAIILLALSALQTRRIPYMRGICAAVFIAFLLGPSLIREEREPVKDVAIIVRDNSPSQSFGTRKEMSEKALAYVQGELGKFADLDVRVVEASVQDELPRETQMFDALDRAVIDIPRSRRAGVLFITDGQVHDAPATPDKTDKYGPVHTLLTGDKNEKDRHLKIIQSPAYGITGQNVTVKFMIDDTGNIGNKDAVITITSADAPDETFSVPVGEEQSIDLPVKHAGQNVFDMQVESVNGELTLANNRAAILVNGVRDRLKVLLVSGQPYAGARTWRDLLTSDPAVDLVHFTILRDPEKIDSTPSSELSLIAFPFQELFETKLFDFDLIIFDRYRMNNILPDHYFENIARFVNKGGALLVTSGPSDSTDQSIYFTSLMDVLPGAPAGNSVKEAYKPSLTKSGKLHPVTKNIEWPLGKDGQPSWGPWLRQVSLTAQSGETLMNGANDKPLLILDRVGEGRVAQIASDHIWLWSRGYDGGGPYAELIRRVVHWLMKEPELDEKIMSVKVSGNMITISSQDYTAKDTKLKMTKPDGTTEDVTLAASADSALQKTIKADQLGIYSFEDSTGKKQFAVVGESNPPELRDVKTTADIMGPVSAASKGGVIWLSDVQRPSVRRVLPGQGQAGYNWMGFRQNGDYTVKGIADMSLLPPWLAMALLISLAVFTWWHEGRSR